MSRANEPAYPVRRDVVERLTPAWHGLTVREEFAKAAMTGILARQDVDLTAPMQGAIVARHWADALIKELEKVQP